jgi:hypothetical protein
VALHVAAVACDPTEWCRYVDGYGHAFLSQ